MNLGEREISDPVDNRQFSLEEKDTAESEGFLRRHKFGLTTAAFGFAVATGADRLGTGADMKVAVPVLVAGVTAFMIGVAATMLTRR